MLLSTLLPLITLSLVSANGHNSPPHKRHLARSPLVDRSAPIERAGGPISNETEQMVSSVEAWSSEHRSTTLPTSAASTESAAAESGKAGDTVLPPSSAVTSASAVATTPATSASPSPVEQQSSAAFIPSSSAAQSIVVSSAAAVPSVQSSINNGPSTITLASSALPTSTTPLVRSTKIQSVITATRTASASSSVSVGSANDATKEEKSGGLSKVALIAIIVVASVVGLGAILVFAIRKWKLGKSNRFDDRLKPIDFSPHNDGHDDFLEKTLQRSGSRNSADMQRQQFVKELETDPNYVAGVPEHDFTAGNNAGYGAYDDTYNADPFAHAKAFEYEQDYYNHHAYPPAAAGAGYDYPTQDQPEEGYANLQRGNSNGSEHAPSRQLYTTDFPSPENYLGRPTGGADGPYAQAAQYRY